MMRLLHGLSSRYRGSVAAPSQKGLQQGVFCWHSNARLEWHTPRSEAAHGWHSGKSPAFDVARKNLSRDRQPAFQGVNHVLGVQFQLLELDFLDLLLCGEIRLLEQLFQPLSVMTMFGMQAINFCAQRGILYFIHPAPPKY